MVKALKTVDDLTPDARNANKGTVRGRAMIEQSIRECGAGRSIVVDREGRVIGGNKTLEVVEELGIPVQVVPTDGTTLVVVQRTDLDLESDPKARRLAYLDNRTTDVDLEWDAEAIAADLEAGVELGDLFYDGELDALLGDHSRADRTLEEIDASDLPVNPVWCLCTVAMEKLPTVLPLLEQLKAAGVTVEMSYEA